MLRVATYNVNGIRAAQRRGFETWLAARDPDVLALQEVRSPVEKVPAEVFAGWHATYDPGRLAGRNGVAVLTRQPPAAVRTWSGRATAFAPGSAPVEIEAPTPTLARGLSRYADEGRYVEVDLADQPLTVASLYLPKGGLPVELQKPGRMREEPDGGARYERKMHFMSAFARHLDRVRRQARQAGRELLLLGDLNIAHQPYDVTNWRRSHQSEGFLPQERAWLDELIGPRTLIDVLRREHGEVDGPYSWWSWMGQAFEKDVGWRIDYHLATPGLARTVAQVEVDREPSREERVSDHAAVVADYAFPPAP
ncbi:exodeoxyribonuclease III [Janibacter alkaliphilus]|uniref:Exodeoxyribonuclease-3 n=1 Tax=Janibacter alkaliphilus TaxID=1069963 RepID=A0A852X7C6_9MICO|nr:exodeoxyribonuclease-3 [Janibacter alkaliphilus]